ncbi:NAD-dependent epimerase/dehydratase family protein [Sodalis sp. dw_96]|uniref:NAD-dependent epimerase/dehydratase family protein n=1 Tax=Sodalis sp. dw_96 TaxID=2719794 RepID=UPI001BD66417|nr:NAD-dependent epimerase/dehydratase family protein [Sodalis sp. dw_96]
MILVTGSQGLIGQCLLRYLRKAGITTHEFDIRRNRQEDFRCADALRHALHGIEGIVHLAAVSRVVWAEKHPELAYSVNVASLRTLLEVVADKEKKPWIIFASSREVYGNSTESSVHEDAPLLPLNAYANMKVQGERLIHDAVSSRIRANICRFSNVYGAISDHADRVAEAFARTAAFGGVLRVDGGENTFDFTHVSDVAEGLFRLVQATGKKELLPPVHFVSGQGVTLNELARLAVSLAVDGIKIGIHDAPPRAFDVSRFVGNPHRAKELLGWEAKTSLPLGFGELISLFRRADESTSFPPWLGLLESNLPAQNR